MDQSPKILLLEVERNCSNLVISLSTETSLSGSQLNDHPVLSAAKLQLFHQHCTYRTWASANGARGAIHNRPLVMTTYDPNDQPPRLPTSRIIDYDNVIKWPARRYSANDASHLNCSYKLPAILPVYVRGLNLHLPAVALPKVDISKQCCYMMCFGHLWFLTVTIV